MLSFGLQGVEEGPPIPRGILALGGSPAPASLTDRDGLVTEEWQPRGLPASYLVDPGGRLRFQALGGLPWDEAPYMDFLKRISIRDE